MSILKKAYEQIAENCQPDNDDNTLLTFLVRRNAAEEEETSQRECPDCDGKGRDVAGNICPLCDGEGTIPRDEYTD